MGVKRRGKDIDQISIASTQRTPISLKISHLIYSSVKALKLHPLQLFHTHNPTFSTSSIFISFPTKYISMLNPPTLPSAMPPCAKGRGELKEQRESPCSEEASMPGQCAPTHSNVLRAPLNAYDRQILGPHPPLENLIQLVCTFNTSPGNSDWDPKNIF